VGIDLLAGPSEIVILADETAPPDYVALDMFSQAEHGVDSASILISTSYTLIKKVKKILQEFTFNLSKDTPAGKSLKNYGALIFAPSLKEGIKLINEIAPEHLELMNRSPRKALPLIKNAGAVFTGPYSPVPLGDYTAGPSHVLPTSGTGRFSQGITTATFMKRISFISSKKEGFLRLCHDAMRMAEIENLEAHKRAISIRRG
jgi:histidinol dehydrogenase